MAVIAFRQGGHLVLLGDSIFDNAPYVPPGQAVIDHLRQLLPPDTIATLLAHDGDVVCDVARQIRSLPADATQLFVSVGGNDALKSIEVMSRPAKTVNDALSELSEVRREFQRNYRAMLWELLNFGKPLIVCTIYDAVPNLSAELKTALCIFNDTITREAMAAGVPVLDLRGICTEGADYSEVSPIEPSVKGGQKIARAIADLRRSFGAQAFEAATQ